MAKKFMSYAREIISLFRKAANYVVAIGTIGAIPLNIYSAQLAKECPPHIHTNSGLWQFGPDYVEFCVVNRIQQIQLQPLVAIHNYKYWSRVMAGNIREGVPGYQPGDPTPARSPVSVPQPR